MQDNKTSAVEKLHNSIKCLKYNLDSTLFVLVYHSTEKKMSSKSSKYVILNGNTRAVVVMPLEQVQQLPYRVIHLEESIQYSVFIGIEITYMQEKICYLT